MPWHLPVDLKHFKSLTLGKPVIVGRKAFEAIGKPLPGRRNMVVAHNRGLYTDGIEVAHSLRDALVLAAGTRAFRGRHFPAALDPGGWRETAREDHATDGRHLFGHSLFDAGAAIVKESGLNGTLFRGTQGIGAMQDAYRGDWTSPATDI